jgi:DNA modification methylase
VTAIQEERNFMGIERLEKYAQLGKRAVRKALEQKRTHQSAVIL